IMENIKSQPQTIKELVLRKISSFNEQPLDFTQLHPNFILPRKWKKIQNKIKTSNPSLSFLIKTHRDVEGEKLWFEIKKYFGTGENGAKSEQSEQLKDKINVRPLVRTEHTKSCWWLLEFPISLGSFLSETKFDL